jgi:type IV secretory pathway VirJ component
VTLAAPQQRNAGLQAAAATLSTRTTPLAQAAPADLKDLPVIEDRAAGDDPTLAIFWSGDGGWATIDKDVSEALQQRGISVVGVDSLRYFWSARTPEDVARDTAAIARHYLTAWNKKRLVLIGFSQGADVLPFAATRLEPALRARVALLAALSLSDHAVFEFHLSNWVADNDNGPATAPEVAKLRDMPLLCLYGEDDEGSVCGQLPAMPRLTVRKLPGDHHFNGDHATLASLILNALPAAR